jgi:hypothetical protein
VLERDGYVLARKGSNGFTCLVVRDHPQDLAPVCHDPEGTRTVVPRLLREAELRARGKSEQQIREEINEGLRTGKYQVPQRVGVAYMLSSETMGFVPELGHAIPVKPHVMFYAPYLRNEDIGAQAPKNDLETQRLLAPSATHRGHKGPLEGTPPDIQAPRVLSHDEFGRFDEVPAIADFIVESAGAESRGKMAAPNKDWSRIWVRLRRPSIEEAGSHVGLGLLPGSRRRIPRAAGPCTLFQDVRPFKDMRSPVVPRLILRPPTPGLERAS